MTPAEFQKVFPLISSWIDGTLSAHAAQAQSVASLQFTRLPQYFSPELLASTKVVAVDRVPMPPLSKMGLAQFAAFEEGQYDGITYVDTFFVKRTCERSETLFFHELIHVVQWRLLGPERFLATYADGLEKYGYRDSPLEAMAYNTQAIFDQSKNAFDAEKLVATQLDL